MQVTQGLTMAEAKTKQATFGKNILTSEEVKWWHVLLRQFHSVFLYLLAIAATIAFLLGDRFEGSMILLFVAINATLGFIQEYRSERTLILLKHYIRSKALALRDGKWQSIPSEELVPGDLIKLQAGDIIPADATVSLAENLLVDESTLTGESVQVNKQHDEPAFSGTTVISGTAQVIVTAIGDMTNFGSIARAASNGSRQSAFEEGIQSFSASILRMVGITLTLVFVTHLFLKRGQSSIGDLLIFSIALAVSVIPEALPLISTISLSRGARHLAKKNAVIKRLSAIEDLGSIDVLCTDKTGTITQNVMSVCQTYGAETLETIKLGLMGNAPIDEQHATANSFDTAIRAYAEKKGIVTDVSLNKYTPFDPMRRRSSAIVSSEGKRLLIVRGAPETVTELCHEASKPNLHDFTHWITDQGRLGRRVLALATNETTDEERELTFVGAISFQDPVKPTATEAIVRATELGVTVKILTGDHQDVAEAVAREIGLLHMGQVAITGQQWQAMSIDERQTKALTTAVFARITPQQKYEIIDVLKKTHTVGFLGEGINDAPALKHAHVALAVREASDIARASSDIILLNKSLHVIIQSIEEGRRVFANTIKYIRTTLASNFGNFYSIAIASLFIKELPMLPVQILLLNLLSDFPMIAISSDNVDEHELLKPKQYNVQKMLAVATLLGSVSTIFDFIIFAVFFNAPIAVLQTNWFLFSVLTELALIYCMRTSQVFFRAKRPALILVVLTGGAAILAIISVYSRFGTEFFSFLPPTGILLGKTLSLVFVYFIASEIAKDWFYKRHKTEMKETTAR